MTEQKLMRALAGEAVWPPPVWLMRQAGRYLPEYRAIRSRIGDFISLCTTPEAAAEVTLQPVRRFGMDAAILFSDILILPWALGWGLHFAEGEGPVLPRWEGPSDTARLDPATAPQRYAPVLETVRRVRTALDPAQSLIGFAGGPFTVASYMVEGGGSKDHARIRALAYQRQSGFDALIEHLTAATIDYLAAQCDAGADCVMLFESWAGLLSPSQFTRYVTQPNAKIVQGLRDRGWKVPVIGFPRLAGSLAASYAIATGIAALGLDTNTDPRMVRRDLPPGIAIQGNLDPVVLKLGGEALRVETASVLAAIRGGPAIFNLGHGIEQHTPPEHVATLIGQIHAS